eukprot:1419911-Rhodomonas_salina.2
MPSAYALSITCPVPAQPAVLKRSIIQTYKKYAAFMEQIVLRSWIRVCGFALYYARRMAFLVLTHCVVLPGEGWYSLRD